MNCKLRQQRQKNRQRKETIQRKKYKISFESGEKNHVKENIRKLYINGKIITDPTNILKELECFYCKLHASGHSVQEINQKDRPF